MAEWQIALGRAATAHVVRARAALAGMGGKLDSLSPLAVLGRGYALVRREQDGSIVRSAGQLASGDRLSIRLAQAQLEAVVASVEPLDDPADA